MWIGWFGGIKSCCLQLQLQAATQPISVPAWPMQKSDFPRVLIITKESHIHSPKSISLIYLSISHVLRFVPVKQHTAFPGTCFNLWNSFFHILHLKIIPKQRVYMALAIPIISTKKLKKTTTNSWRAGKSEA